MSMSARELLARVEADGYSLTPNPPGLKIRGPCPLSPEMMEALRQHKNELLWHTSLAMLKAAPRPAAFSPARWARLVADAEHFVEHRATEAEAAGWSITEAFGCDPLAPLARLDHAGVVVLIDGAEIVRITPDRIVTRHARGALLSIYGRPRLKPGSTVLLWQLPPVRGDEP